MKTKNRKQIMDTIQKIYQCLYADREYVNLSIGVSEIHSNLHGLQKAYKEASSSFYKYNEKTQVLAYPTYDHVVFTQEDEHSLIRSLSSDKKTRCFPAWMESGKRINSCLIRKWSAYIIIFWIHFWKWFKLKSCLINPPIWILKWFMIA